MGKGDKKTKRGKIVIGSYGVRRARRKKHTGAPVLPPPAPVEVKPKKTAVKKTETPAVVDEPKPKTPRTKKKAAEGEAS